MSAIAHLALIPRDGLFCKDGRGWHTSASGRGHALDWPWPSTVLGALRSAWGRAAETRTGALFAAHDWRANVEAIKLQRNLALRRGLGSPWSIENRVWSVPADALWLEGREQVFRLDPCPPHLETLGRNDDDIREALWVPVVDDSSKPMTPPRWWAEEHFAAWLAAEGVRATPPGGWIAPTRRVQTHVGIQPEQLTADDGVLFCHDVLETLECKAEWAIGVEVAYPGQLDLTILTLGSDSRATRAERISHELFNLSVKVRDAFRAGARGLRLVAVSPLSFARGWLPDGLEPHGREYRGRLAGCDVDLVLRAAMVPRAVHVSGWNVAACAPKPTSRLVPPGAVYFFERADGHMFASQEAQALWLAAVGDRSEEGYGRVVPGVWNPKWRP